MKTSVIEVRDMLSVLSVQGVETRIGDVPGVESVTVNYAAGNATVRYDETRLGIADIKAGVRQIGYEAADAPGAAEPDNAAQSTTPKPSPSAAPKPAANAVGGAPATAVPAGDDHQHKAAAEKS